MTRLSAVAAAAAVVGFSYIPSPTEAHITCVYPLSRQESYGPRYKQWDDEDIEYCPHCYNARGPKFVKERAKALTDPAELEKYGGGDEFPLYHGEFAANGNYLETDEIAVRHGVCGDPEQNMPEGTNKYSTANINWPVLDSFTSGQVLEIDIVMNAYHWGHCEFFVCNTDEMDDPDGVPTQECFNKYPLTRAPDDGDASPIDPKYPGRYYVDPECRGGETEQSDNAVKGYNIHMRYVMPDIECEHCIFQMVYYTGNSCKHIGYDEFNPEKWPGSCASEKKDWIELNRYICGENGAYPEEFWACSDFSMSRDGSAPAPTPVTPDEMPVAEPTAEPTSEAEPLAEPTAEPTPEATAEPTPEATAEPTPEATAEPTPEPTAEATAEPTDDSSPMCSNGVPGIESSKGACCVAECGQCGGIGCSTVAKDLGLGSAECCEGTILLANEPCGEAPCVVGDGMVPAPAPTETEMPVDMPVALPGDDMSYSFSFSFDMDDDDMGDDDMFPVDGTPSPVPVMDEGMCSNGVRGIESKGACCVFECGQCGGSGCSTVGKSLGLGAADCCESTVLANNEPCGEAPCVIGDGTTVPPSPTPTETEKPVAMPVAPTMTEEPVGMPVAPTMTEEPVDMPTAPTMTEEPVDMPVAPTMTEEPVDMPVAPTMTEEPVDMPVAPTMTEEPVDMPVAPTMTEKPVDMPVAPTMTEEPVDMPVMPPTDDSSPMCSNGVPGIESSKGACCVAECGQCGGIGCSTVAMDKGLGSAECCEGTILLENKPCAEAGEAPCVVGDEMVPSPTPTETEKPAGMPAAPTATEKPAGMPAAPTATEKPAGMPAAPTATEKPAGMPAMPPTKDDSSDSGDMGSTTTTSETSYLPSSDTDTYTDGTGVDPEDVPEDMPGTYEHLGCFKDSKEDRVLTRSKLGRPDMTADVCFEYCSTRGAAYMALQFGFECWCSRNGMLEYERHGDGAVCDYPCLGDENDTCGGYDAFDLFKLWWPTEPEDPEYVGCYHDDKQDRVLAHKVTIPGMTTAVCRDYCSDKDALFYATQYSTECWCGTSDIEGDYERHGPGNCYMGCDGEEGVACGGFDSFSLFKYGDGETPTPTPEPTTGMPTMTEEPTSTDMPTSTEEPTATEMPASTEEPTATEMPTTTEEPASTCSNGVPGIESSKGACCVAECGQCGGIGCSTVAMEKGLGSAECCEGTILLENKPCGEAPCVVGDEMVPTPTPSETEPPASETPAPLVATPSEECEGDPVPVYEQCGGDTWKGSTCCEDGLECRVMGKSTCYSQCRPVDSPTPTPAEPTPEPTPEATAEPTPEATAEPTPEATAEPTPEATAEPTPEATAEPTPEATAEATPEPTAEPTPEPQPVAPPTGGGGDDCRVVIIEAEDLPVTGAWKVVSDSDASGGKYIAWEGLSEGRNNQSPDDGDVISTSIDITTPGTYSFKWLMRQPSGVESDKGNDSWLYFPDATRFGPKGKTSSYGTFIKVYGRATKGMFEYSGTAEANHEHTQIAVEFAQAGRYTMEIAGRSHGHEIDQIILFGEGSKVADAAGGC